MKQLLITIATVLLMECGTSIYEAAEEGKIEEVKQLLTDGADVNPKTDSYLETPFTLRLKMVKRKLFKF